MKFTTTRTKSKAIIDAVEVTNDTLTGRGGLHLFARYLRNIHIFQQIDTLFGSMRRSRKGQSITEIFRQLLSFFVDGISRHLVDFDILAKDAGYAAATESGPGSMLSSPAVKSFFFALFAGRASTFFATLGVFVAP